jgi:hypothetical protein
MMGATAKQIESAIGMTVAHYVPFRAIRAGKQLSDSKGASAGISGTHTDTQNDTHRMTHTHTQTHTQ